MSQPPVPHAESKFADIVVLEEMTECGREKCGAWTDIGIITQHEGGVFALRASCAKHIALFIREERKKFR
jgi:hypothetical protein